MEHGAHFLILHYPLDVPGFGFLLQPGSEAAFGTERGDARGPTSHAFLYASSLTWDGLPLDQDPFRPLLLPGEARTVVRTVTQPGEQGHCVATRTRRNSTKSEGGW